MIPSPISKDYFAGISKCVVAFSGGTDSALVLRIAADTLGKGNVTAVTGISETYPASDLKSALKTAKQLGVSHILLRTRELKNRKFSCNTKLRCFYCKSELFSKIKKIADSRGATAIFDGSNYDDKKDYRPGRAAAQALGVRSPLLENRIGKKKARTFLRRLGMGVWNKPPSPCLASRIPYGTPITLKTLKNIEDAENALHKGGFRNLRVRHHGNVARIEVDKKDIPRLLRTMNPAMIKKIKSMGYKYVTIDAEGFRSGSLNEQ